MMQFDQSKIIAKIIKPITYLLIFWIIFLLGKSLWQNWALKHSIWQLNEQIATLNQQKKDLENLNLYYSSDSFKELEARKMLGLKKPGEKMVILPASPGSSPTAAPSNFPEEVMKEKEAISGVENPVKIPNWALWWQYFTKF